MHRFCRPRDPPLPPGLLRVPFGTWPLGSLSGGWRECRPGRALCTRTARSHRFLPGKAEPGSGGRTTLPGGLCSVRPCSRRSPRASVSPPRCHSERCFPHPGLSEAAQRAAGRTDSGSPEGRWEHLGHLRGAHLTPLGAPPLARGEQRAKAGQGTVSPSPLCHRPWCEPARNSLGLPEALSCLHSRAKDGALRGLGGQGRGGGLTLPVAPGPGTALPCCLV